MDKMVDDNRVKIAILATVFWSYDGISRVVENQARELAAKGYGVTIFTLAANMSPPEGVSLCVMGMPESSLAQRIYRLLFPLDLIKAIKYTPRLKGFSIIYSHQYPLSWLAYLAKKRYGARYIYYNHGIAHAGTFSSPLERLYISLITFMANWTIKRADGGISISRYMRDELKRQTGLDSEVVYNRIDKTRFHEGIDSSIVRRKYNLDSSPVALFVGRISPHKGVSLLIEAFRLVRQEMPQARLLIVGRHSLPSYSRKLDRMSDGSVIFTDDVPDEELPFYYAACDVYATATLWEGFNLPLAEAQACGKPVVAFNIGPHGEIINKEGILVPAGDIKKLADGLLKVMRRLSLLNIGSEV